MRPEWDILFSGLERIRSKYPSILTAVYGKGLVAGIPIADPKTGKPDGVTALKINTVCCQKGLLMFAPVGSDAGFLLRRNSLSPFDVSR